MTKAERLKIEETQLQRAALILELQTQPGWAALMADFKEFLQNEIEGHFNPKQCREYNVRTHRHYVRGMKMFEQYIKDRLFEANLIIGRRQKESEARARGKR